MSLKIKQTNTFKKYIKKLSIRDKKEVDGVVKLIAKDPFIGEQKKGDLDFLRVYKFKLNKQLILLGYNYNDGLLTLTLLKIGSHENFYRDIRR
ncbi:type II toxin-antitoxin system RelE/ParE family toxin [Francisella hispaniensis]|nr:type II toxin-antitoxin system RelE/ParE family toxin [Francisella hispaniensis]